MEEWRSRFRQRFSELKTKQGLTQEKLGDCMGVTQGTIGHWLRGRRTPETLEQFRSLARCLDTSYSWLLTGAEESEQEVSNVEPGPDIRGIHPLISWVQAGKWCEIMDDFAPGDAEEWIPCPVNCGPQTFVLRVVGVSMEPRFREGELVFVDPSRRAENGSFVVVRLEDRQEATFKQLVQEGGRQYLKALNPAWPDPIIEVTERATVCGVVVFKGEQL